MRKISLKSTTSLVLALSLATPTFAQTSQAPFPCVTGDGQSVESADQFARALIVGLTNTGSATPSVDAAAQACGIGAYTQATQSGGEELAMALATATADTKAMLIPTQDAAAPADVQAEAATDPAAVDAIAADQATGDQAAADQAAAEQAAADQAAADEAASDQAAADQATTDQAVVEEAPAEGPAATDPAAEPTNEDVAAAAAAAAIAGQVGEPSATADAEATAPAVDETTIEADTTAETSTPPADPAPAADAAPAHVAPAGDAATNVPAVAPDAEPADTAATEAPADATDQASAPEAPAPLTPEEQAARAAEREAARQSSAAAMATSEDIATATDVVTEEVTQDTVRSADEDFETAVTGDQPADATATTTADTANDGPSNFEKALILGLGAVAVGALLNNGDRVVSNSGDRVVVQRDGELRVLKNDDVLLRQAGSQVATRTFDDGSTLTTITREDGSVVTTIRAADGTVLRRSLTKTDGTQVALIDDLEATTPVEVSNLPPVPQEVVSTSSVALTDQAALEAALSANLLAQTNRSYSLEQVRDIRQVRALAPQVELSTITFETGSAAIQPSQADELAGLGGAIRQIVANDPSAIFLIEGHTDAVGDAGYNLALSDRRAETVALALSQYFQVPPENLVTQGYGEQFLKVQTESGERANRRAAVRNISGLLRNS